VINDAEELVMSDGDEVLNQTAGEFASVLHDLLGRCPNAPRAPQIEPLVVEVLRFVWKTLDQRPSVPEIAQRVGLSHRSLSRLIKEHLGCTVVQAVRSARLECAKRRLVRCTGRSITEIALIAGYSSLNRMEEQFRDELGMTPREYRERHEDQHGNGQPQPNKP
jgi:transcriptional regulator GlxA family with amidase domain